MIELIFPLIGLFILAMAILNVGASHGLTNIYTQSRLQMSDGNKTIFIQIYSDRFFRRNELLQCSLDRIRDHKENILKNFKDGKDYTFPYYDAQITFSPENV